MSKKRVTLKMLSEKTGFDVSTISRLLRGDRTLSIRSENAELIRRTASELGYVPDVVGRSLRSSRSYSVAALLPSLQNQIHAQIVEGASHVCRERGYSLIIAHLAGTDSIEDLYADLVARNRVEGVMSLTYREELAQIAATAGPGIPVMAVNWRAPGFNNSVTLDERPGARMATEHLLQLGHTRIAHLSGDLRRFNAAERFKGYEEALVARGIAVSDDLVVPSGYGFEDGVRAMDVLLERGPRDFTAIFAVSLLTAAGAIKALTRRNIRVPEDVSVIGFNDGTLAEVMSPSLSTIAYPLADLGRAAADGMIALLDGGTRQCQKVIGGPVLMQRGSTARCPVERTP